jgi:hypothetical protein
MHRLIIKADVSIVDEKYRLALIDHVRTFMVRLDPKHEIELHEHGKRGRPKKEEA